MSNTSLAVAEPTAVSDDELFAEALAAEAEADDAESDARWRAADAYAELNRRGYSTRQIGERVGKSHVHVSWCLKAAAVNPVNRGLFAEHYAEAKGNVHFSSETPEWSTPQDLFDELDAEFGFTLDVCATHENHKCGAYFTAEDDGLEQNWTGVCWMNPPYGRTIGDWLRKAYESAEAGATVVCLIPARPGSGWMWDFCRHGEVRLMRGRLAFGDGDNSAPFDSAVVIFGREPSVVWWERV